MPLSIRQNEILELARSEGRVSVEDLAARYEVTLQTIRRDLSDLAEAGLVDRVHGGAVARQGVVNLGYEARRDLNAEAKARIAAKAAALIPDNSSLILNLGTTTEAVAQALINHKNITVITNNINVANILAGNSSCEIMVTGGALRRSDGGLVGELATQFFENFKVDYAIIGTSALDYDGDLLDFDMAEVRVSRAILRQARQSILVTDHSKIGRAAPARITSLSQINRLITDQPLPRALAELCSDWQTEVILV